MIVGGIIQSATYGAAQLIAGRLISGVGNGVSLIRLRLCILLLTLSGMNTSIVPVYVSECSHAKHRGRAVAVQLSIVIVTSRPCIYTTKANFLS
jgi:MFS family permease